MYKYVHEIDSILRDEVLFTGSGESLGFDDNPRTTHHPTSSASDATSKKVKHPLIPPHFFGEFAKTKRGAEKILDSPYFDNWCALTRKYSKMRSLDQRSDEEFKAILWTLVSLFIQHALRFLFLQRQHIGQFNSMCIKINLTGAHCSK